MKANITVGECKALWSSYRRKQRRVEALFNIKGCECREAKDAHEMGSTALAMKVCKHKSHPYHFTRFPAKCTIELCPLKNNR